MEKKIEKVKRIKGELRVPSDKSISHRSIILTSLAEGKSIVKNFLKSGDTLTTLNCYKQLGVKIEERNGILEIEGVGLKGLKEPDDILDMGNSGTTTRLTLGVLAGQNLFATLTGDNSLRNRPMKRVKDPLTQMGAFIDGRENGNRLPLAIRGGNLKGISFFNKKSSAQVKSAILLAGLNADGKTEIEEPVKSRNHTEKLLKAMGVNLKVKEEENYKIILDGNIEKLNPIEIDVPADPSSAAFFVAAAVIVPNSEILLKDVLVNPTRDGFFRKLKDMGANIEYLNLREKAGEEVADIYVRYTPDLKGIKITKVDVPSMIDELPLIMLIATQVKGETVITGAEELRVKESDRIKAVVENLKNIGVEIEELEDGAIIRGKQKIKGGVIDSFNDHRIAMGFSILGLIAEDGITIKNAECVFISYPEFYEHLEKVVEV
ncbi:MAG: 3-phosphoshikimate 1-carboxyvinyltransferase [Persephonella sp.]|nr:MAG: 3-phosphoshikimate 1-carboxyvinyltransferase [Persephonella sp.]